MRIAGIAGLAAQHTLLHTLLHMLVWTIVVAGLPLPASARPVDLTERRARPVQVAIEISPPHLPARLDHHYSDRRPAWLEPGPGPDEVTIRVPGPEMERLLASYDPVPGSFEDYVWVFESETGHVLSATLHGALFQRVEWGFLSTRVEAGIAASMSTLRAAGFLPPRSRWGHVLFEHCVSLEDECSVVPPRPYDPSTGYVNAVGSLRAMAIGGFRVVTFSPLGEAVFTEMRADTAVSAR